MQQDSVWVENELERFRRESGSDFCAIAWMEERNDAKWNYTAGNRNQRYRLMKLKPGKGLAGLALRINRPVILDATKADWERTRSECPIMLSENLQAAVAAPMIEGLESRGILLAGSRSMKQFNKNEITFVVEEVERFMPMLYAVSESRQ